MNYKIDNKIIFREDDGKLWNIINPEQSARLSVIPKRILSYLIQNSAQIVNRNDLLENIWDKNGLQSSNNSLSQNISILRKTLQDLGCANDIILTLPKVGFRINECVTIEAEYDVHSEQIQVATPLHQPSTTSAPQVARGYIKRVVLMASIMASIVITIILLQFIKNENDIIIPNSKLYPIGEIKTCKVYTLHQPAADLIESNMKLATEMVNKYLPCTENQIFIVQFDDKYIYWHSGRFFMSRCIPSTPKRDNFSSCQDLYINEY